MSSTWLHFTRYELACHPTHSHTKHITHSLSLSLCPSPYSLYRVYALANKKAELEFEQRSMASLLSKFRIDYSDLTLIPDITKKPLETSTQFFNELIKDFVVAEKENGHSSKATLNEDEGRIAGKSKSSPL